MSRIDGAGALAVALPDVSELAAVAPASGEASALRLEPVEGAPPPVHAPRLSALDVRGLGLASSLGARARRAEAEVAPSLRPTLAAVVAMTEVAAELEGLLSELGRRARPTRVRA